MPWPFYNPFSVRLTVDFLSDPTLEEDFTIYSEPYYYSPKLSQMMKAEIEYGAIIIARERLCRLTGFHPSIYIHDYPESDEYD